MSTDIFVNISTSDLDRSKAFFEGLGWSINPLFTDENAACVVIDDHVYLMVLSREFFATFTDLPIGDPHVDRQFEIALSRTSREEVDALVAKAIEFGGKKLREPQDYGFMYSQDFEDPDGNQFSALWMEPAAVEKGPEAFMAERGATA